MIVRRSIDLPVREGLTTNELWFSDDEGLIKCWENGREFARRDPERSERAKMGELPASDWKGGMDEQLKVKKKIGTLRYLAEWMGLRGDSLDIDTDLEPVIVCTRFGVEVTFTGDPKKYGNA